MINYVVADLRKIALKLGKIEIKKFVIIPFETDSKKKYGKNGEN